MVMFEIKIGYWSLNLNFKQKLFVIQELMSIRFPHCMLGPASALHGSYPQLPGTKEMDSAARYRLCRAHAGPGLLCGAAQVRDKQDWPGQPGQHMLHEQCATSPLHV